VVEAKPSHEGWPAPRSPAEVVDRLAAVELIHTYSRITDPERSIAFYDALGFEKHRELPIRDEAVNSFLGLPGDSDQLELTYNLHDPDGYQVELIEHA
jgi:catechol 2,3-dioxygenase-like lactoylglutathione lyase family enzyme